MAAFTSSFRRPSLPTQVPVADGTPQPCKKPVAEQNEAEHGNTAEERESVAPSSSITPAQKPTYTALGPSITAQSAANQTHTDAHPDSPWTLIAGDLYNLVKLAWALPCMLWPAMSTECTLSELAPTARNLWCLLVHSLLAAGQLTFLGGVVPAACLLPVWLSAVLVAVCLGVNRLACRVLLNGWRSGTVVHSSPECAPGRPEHGHEQWIFMNGVGVGQHWMQSSVDRLAATFQRPVLGIHSKTSGIVFDAIECLVQRHWGFATRNVRVGYGILRESLYRPDIATVVFVLHSRGAIDGGLVIDRLLQELPRDLMAKLEVYTFGSAASHFSNPHHRAQGPHAPAVDNRTINGQVGRLVFSIRPGATTGRAIGHVEHYAHTADVFAWGVPTMSASQPESVFARSSPRGHHFCQHYLDSMFPLARDRVTGAFGCAETGNQLMESIVEVEREADEALGWLASREWQLVSNGPKAVVDLVDLVEVQATETCRPVRVKDVSRLWQYRNGRIPDDRKSIRCL